MSRGKYGDGATKIMDITDITDMAAAVYEFRMIINYVSIRARFYKDINPTSAQRDDEH